MHREEYIVTILVGALVLLSGGIFLASMKRAPAQSVAGERSSDASSSTAASMPRAFIRIQPFEPTAQVAHTWSVAYETNVRSACRLEAYDPNGSSVELSRNGLSVRPPSERAQLFGLIWDIPLATQPGMWTIRLLCGTTDNLVTSNIPIFIN